MALYTPSSSSLLDLSDDVLLLIFTHLKSWDLLNLSKTCERFMKVACDKSLWIEADFSDGCLSVMQLKRCLIFLRSSTRRLVLRGHKKKFGGTPKWKTPLLSADLLKRIGEKCPNLQELTLSEAFVDASKLKVTDFRSVKSLLKFSLIDCEFVKLPRASKTLSYFKTIQETFPKLECLEIIKCGWVDDYDLMVLSKTDSLKTLVLRNLPKVGEVMAHFALGFRFGFQNLEELDMRGTSLLDSDVASIVQNGKLRALYLGPMGPVRRLSGPAASGHNLIMPDPRWQGEKQQVIVINVGPNGPQWRHVNDEELDGLGLEWVRNAPALQHQRAAEDEDQHYFIDKDGLPIVYDSDDGDDSDDGNDSDNDDDDQKEEDEEFDGQGPQLTGSAPAHEQASDNKSELPDAHSREKDNASDEDDAGKEEKDVEGEHTAPRVKRSKPDHQEEQREKRHKPDEADELGDGQEDEPNQVGTVGHKQKLTSFKKRKKMEEEDDNLDVGYELKEMDDNLQCEAYQVPDEGMSDKLVLAFGEKTRHLNTLVLSGCAISDQGLLDIIRLVPSLRLLDLTNTKVTNTALQEARVARPECVILGGGTRLVRQQNNR